MEGDSGNQLHEPRRAHRVPLWIQFGTLAFVAALVVAFVVASNGGEPWSRSASKSTTSTSAAPSTAAPTTTLAPTTAAPTTTLAPTTTVPSVRDQMVAWATRALPNIQRLGSSLNAVGNAAESGDLDRTAVACSEFHDANEALEGDLPSPDPTLTEALRQATADFDASAHQCMQGITNRDVAMVNAAAQSMRQGAEHLQTARTILEAYE